MYFSTRVLPDQGRTFVVGHWYDNVLFGSEMLGAVKGIDPNTGEYFDDTEIY